MTVFARNLRDLLMVMCCARGGKIRQVRGKTWFRLEILEGRWAPSVSMLVGADINITKTSFNEAETSIAVNPTNINNVFAIDTNSYQGHYSLDGGQTWKNSNMTGFTSAGLHDAQTIFDSFGNLFVTRMGTTKQIEVGVSSDGGATFSSVQIISGTPSAGNDQPTLASGPSGVGGVPGAIWVSYEQAGVILAAGASVNGLGSVGTFGTPETAPGSTNGDYGSMSVGPSGQMMVSYQDGLSGGAAGNEGPGTMFINVDPDGLGAGGFNAAVSAHGTNVGGTTAVPPQPGPFNVGGRTIDAESNVAYDLSGGAHNGRVYMVYTDRSSVPPPTNNNTDIFVIYSDNNGTNWSSPVRVNDDPSSGTTGATQYLPAIAVDQSTGFVAVSWYDTRNSSDGTTRDTYASVSTDGGNSWLGNVRLSAATSNPLAAAVGTFNSGDLDLMSYAGGVFYRSWSDNSNSTGDNPAGAGNAYDIYTDRVAVGTAPVVTAPANQNADEGTAKSFNLGSFTDPDGGPWSVSVDWGDSKPITTFSQSATGSLGTKTHTYDEEGNYTVQVTVTDSLGFNGSTTFKVATADLAVIAAGGPVTAVEGQDSGSVVVATFTDPGGAEPLADYTATIDWGDGTTTTTGTISVSAGTFSVSGNHTYAEETAADHPGSSPYNVKVTISHETATDAIATSTVTVSDPAVVATGGMTINAVRGAPICDVPVATFIDPGGPEALGDYSATIDWGDGGTSAGELSYNSTTKTFTVAGDHVYANSGTNTIKVTAHHENAPDAVATSTATVTAFGIGQGPCDPNTLLIGGTTGDDTIRVVPVGTTAVAIQINNVTVGTEPLSAFSSIAIYGQDGNDDLQVDLSITRAAFIFGGPGNDRLHGGGGTNYLDGGAGNDTLTGGGGRNVLIGGGGSDSLNGQSSDDLLITGALDFEDYTNCDNEPKICLLFETWTDPLSNFSTRVAAVNSLLAGHLINDSATDTVNGGPGQDLIYLSNGDIIRGTIKSDVIMLV